MRPGSVVSVEPAGRDAHTVRPDHIGRGIADMHHALGIDAVGTEDRREEPIFGVVFVGLKLL